MGEGRQRQQADRLLVLTDEGKQLPHQQHTQDCRLVWTLWAGGVRELQPEMCARHITDAVDGAGVVIGLQCGLWLSGTHRSLHLWLAKEDHTAHVVVLGTAKGGGHAPLTRVVRRASESGSASMAMALGTGHGFG